MPPSRRRTALDIGLSLSAAFLLCIVICAFLWEPIKSNVLSPLIPYLPAPTVPIVLSILKPLPLPYELLHDDAYLRERVAPPPNVAFASPVLCDGDGVSGARVQLIYAHAIDVEDRYALFVDAFQQYAADIDNIFLSSAAETGGIRRLRWVHNAECFPTVLNITLSATGDDSFSAMVSEMWNLGYQSRDRKYGVFVDAHVYCGISDISYDDRIGQENVNNYGPSFARVDNGCWDSIPMGHELMHTLGAVQVSAPHSSQEWHCWDVDDLMCRPTNGTPTQQLCAYVFNRRYDCNHDDYFNTNPLADNYLATHWNAANSRFVLGAVLPPVVQPTPTPCFRGNSGKPCK